MNNSKNARALLRGLLVILSVGYAKHLEITNKPKSSALFSCVLTSKEMEQRSQSKSRQMSRYLSSVQIYYMNKFRLIETGLLTLLFIIAFSSCRKEKTVSEPESNPEATPTRPENSKKLVKIVEKEFEIKEGYTDEGYITYTFTYDKQGNVIYTSEQEENAKNECTNFIYKNNTISFDISDMRYGSSLNEKVEFKLSNNLIMSAKRVWWLSDSWESGYSFNFEYNSDGLLTKYTQSGIGNQNLSWDGFKLTQSKSDNYHFEERIFEYDSKTCNGYNPIIVFFYNNVFTPILAKPELLGLRTNQLPKSMKEGDETVKFTYQVYNDGYLKECEAIWEDEGEGSIYTFTWE